MPYSPKHVFDYRDRHVYPFHPRLVRRLQRVLINYIHNRSIANSHNLRRAISDIFQYPRQSRYIDVIERALLHRRGPLGGSSIVWSPNFYSRLRDLMEDLRTGLNDLSDDEDDDELRVWNYHSDDEL